jgi:hypothetical protein
LVLFARCGIRIPSFGLSLSSRRLASNTGAGVPVLDG